MLVCIGCGATRGRGCRAESLACLQGNYSDESGSDDEWTDDEEESTALDPIDPFVSFSDTLRGLQARSLAHMQSVSCPVLPHDSFNAKYFSHMCLAEEVSLSSPLLTVKDFRGRGSFA